MYQLKKSLGQHFLKDGQIVEKIVAALGEHDFDQLLEVGPGGGALTKYLLKLSGIRFKAVELDEEKVNYLRKTFSSYSPDIIHRNFLDIEPPFEGSFTVIGNFPYNISTQILFKLLEWKDQVPVIIGMFQKEVAERASASPGSKSFGVLSALVQPFYRIEYLFDVPPQAFNPPPKVMSGVIRLTRNTESLNVRSIKAYTMLVKTAFNQRRKTLRNAVRGLFDPEVLKEPVFDKRAEALGIQDFAELTFKMR
jgi:16S rRNA (adenine1518-N6/adenine1519-N6)-dimethyltransferase